MKRASALQPLSHDHHQALFVAQKLRRATEETAIEARDQLLAYWHNHGAQHFRREEEELLPAYAGHGDPGHPLVVQVLVDHVEIRRRARDLEQDGAPSVKTLRKLGVRLSDHVRLEERELFPLIEETVPVAELELLAARLASVESARET